MDWKPYNYNEDGIPKGYSIDYMNLVAKKLGIDIEYVSGPTWSEFMTMLQDGNLDVMLNIANTKDRRQFMAFTDSYHITSVSLYVRNAENGITDLDNLAGKRLGIIEGFFFGEFIRRYYPRIELVNYPSSEAVFIGVQKGEVDAAMEVPLVARTVLRDAHIDDVKLGGKVSDPLFITTFTIGTHKDNAVLRDIIQKGIDAITPVDLLAINQKWGLKDGIDGQFGKDDIEHLKKLGELRLCVHPNRLPLEALNRDGTLTGVSSEFVKLLGARLETPLRVVVTQNWAQSQRFLQERLCDIVPMAVKTKAQNAYLDFTKPWLSQDLVIATRNDQIYVPDLAQLTNPRIGVVQDELIGEELLAAYPNLQLVGVADVDDGLAKVGRGELFGFIDTLAIVSRALQTQSVPNVKISGSTGVKALYAIGVRNDDETLLGIMNRAIEIIDPAQINGIHNRWLAVAYVERVDYSLLWKALAGISIVTAFVFYRYRRGVEVSNALRTANAKVEAANRELDNLARTDALTGLSNRLKIGEVLHDEETRFNRYETPFSVIMLDLDHFKAINDQHGHDVGDRVLKRTAEILQNHTREIDQTGRWGGEEFLIVCPATPCEGAVKMAEALRSALHDDPTDDLPRQTASMGVAQIRPGESIRELMRRADDALYRAKSNGRNRVEKAD